MDNMTELGEERAESPFGMYERATVANLRAVADAARLVQKNANPRPEYAGLVKIIVHVEDWQALSDAFDKLDEDMAL